MKKTWLRLILTALLGLLLCISLIACTDPNNEKDPTGTTQETTDGSTTEENSDEKPVDTDPLDEKVGNKGENTDPEWGNDVIA